MNSTNILNSSLLTSVIRGTPYTGTVSEFQSICEITSRSTYVEVLDMLIANGIGSLNKAQITFSAQDKLNIIQLALQQNCNPKRLAKNLNWKDFEDFVSVILQKIGYSCKRNVHLRKPHMQIDVVATMGKKALIIDCKHWKNSGAGKMEECAKHHLIRTKSYVTTYRDIDYAIPIIVTLNEPLRNTINRIPIVPISKFGSFLSNYDVWADQLLHV